MPPNHAYQIPDSLVQNGPFTKKNRTSSGKDIPSGEPILPKPPKVGETYAGMKKEVHTVDYYSGRLHSAYAQSDSSPTDSTVFVIS